MMYAGRMLLLALTLVVSVTALPNHLKAVVLDTDPVPVSQGTGASASFGGYSANAGQGGAGPAGGLYAAVESPFGSAAVGLVGAVSGDKGTVASSAGGTLTKDQQGSAGTHAAGASAPAPPPGHTGGHKPGVVHQGPGAFDNIFNIPISVLQAVNTYLNNRGPVTRPLHRRRGHRPRPGHADDDDVVYKTVVPVKGEGPPAAAAAEGSAASAVTGDASAATPAPAAPVAPAYDHHVPDAGYHNGRPIVYKRVNYDDIFNIPISALKSVNDLLNG